MKKKNKRITLFSLLIIPVFFSGIFSSLSPCKPTAPAPFTLEFWSVFDDSEIYRPLIQKFQESYSYITVDYYKKNVATYEQELIDALASGRGPDIFVINNTWLPKHIEKLSSAPGDSITPKWVSDTFVDVVFKDFVVDNKVYALPLSVDSLALFYNKDLLNSAGIAQPPQTWAEFNSDVELLTRRDEKNNILRAGAALGIAGNINRSTDILALLMMQGGAQMVNDDKTAAVFDQMVNVPGGESFSPGEQALTFYTNFANPNKKVYTWNDFQHYSIDAFAEGQVAMMVNYSYQAPSLRSRAPHLDFGVAPIPKISLSSQAVSFANYWGLAVSKDSASATGAWQFIAFLVGQENAKSYLESAQKPVARRDLIDWQKSDARLGVFATQALVAKSWWEVDNLAVEASFAQMINSVVANRAKVNDAVRTASQQITLLIQKYNLNKNKQFFNERSL